MRIRISLYYFITDVENWAQIWACRTERYYVVFDPGVGSSFYSIDLD